MCQRVPAVFQPVSTRNIYFDFDRRGRSFLREEPAAGYGEGQIGGGEKSEEKEKRSGDVWSQGNSIGV